jgi:hypothetical protein
LRARRVSVACRQEDELIEVSAGQAKSAAFTQEADPGAAAQRLAALVARGFTTRNEYLEILWLCAHRKSEFSVKRRARRKSVMTRISSQDMARAVGAVRAMDFGEKEALADEVFRVQPHMLASVVVQKELGVSLEKIDFGRRQLS